MYELTTFQMVVIAGIGFMIGSWLGAMLAIFVFKSMYKADGKGGLIKK